MMLHQAECRLDNSAQHGFALPVFITVCICLISLASFVINIFFTISLKFGVKEQILSAYFQMLFFEPSSSFSHHLYDLLPW